MWIDLKHEGVGEFVSRAVAKLCVPARHFINTYTDLPITFIKEPTNERCAPRVHKLLGCKDNDGNMPRRKSAKEGGELVIHVIQILDGVPRFSPVLRAVELNIKMGEF